VGSEDVYKRQGLILIIYYSSAFAHYNIWRFGFDFLECIAED